MNRRDRIEAQRLAQLEAEFEELLIPCLKQCARGRWGLFGAYDRFPELKTHLNWPEKDRLRDLANIIRSIRSKAGEKNELCEEFLTMCTLHRANDPGEPKLATEFLERIRRPEAKVAPEESPSGE
jgi:hypothetical protein